jgi:hypothetical protein
MNTFVIYINWEYFLGLVGTLIVIAYYASGRFARLDTSVEWLKETVSGLQIAFENRATKLFGTRSPISLTLAGRRMLTDSGLASYIDAHKIDLAQRIAQMGASDKYKVQSSAFRLFADLAFERPLQQRLDQFAYANGVSTDILRRIGAIYLRDLIS